MPQTPVNRPQPDPKVPAVEPVGAVISIRDLKAACATCSLRELCMPFGFTAEQLAHIDSLVGSRKRLRKGETLFDSGDGFSDLYAVWMGSLKTTVLAEDGREQVTGYQLPGDIIGLDGIGDDRHTGRAVALQDSEVCVLPFHRLEVLARKVPALQHNLQRFLAREITRDQTVMLLLGSMRAEERVAAFLLDVAERYRRRGYSGTNYVLRMTREEIGSFLGLKLETVSRLFSRFQQEGIVRIQGREVTILDGVALRQLCGTRA
ncbi:MAG TPA: fumarate/nitrate reduction transcriptional regulator Fnr [Casimicrobiaceae bacterium]|nr:fumarate/nitrate reduction transcriptional regulator Fnr [Casimicrobiaceae bacterium]